MAGLVSVATYRRSVGASLERVWENVRDWEHLPWLHRESFSSIALEEEGGFGWRARVGLGAAGARGPDDTAERRILLELVVEDEGSYVARTLEGPGAGTEIWTRLAPTDAGHTAIAVEFLVPGASGASRQALGDAYVALYTRLWDQDEAMMRRRAHLLGAGAVVTSPSPESLDLGPAEGLRERLPLVVDLGGRRVRVVEHEGGWIAHDATCPHWLGPLEDAPLEDGRLVCPWHGYRFDPRTGRCDEHPRLRLAPAPRVEVEAGRARLVPATAEPGFRRRPTRS